MTQMPSPAPVVPPPVKGGAGWNEVLAYPLACAGAMLGAGVGAGLAYVASREGFYAMIAVGVCTGFGAALIGRRHNLVIGVMAAVIALVGGMLAEAWLYPWYTADGVQQDFAYFVQHIPDMSAFRLLVHGLGAACAGWIGWRR